MYNLYRIHTIIYLPCDFAENYRDIIWLMLVKSKQIVWHDPPDHHMGEYMNGFVKSEKLPISVDFSFAVYI